MGFQSGPILLQQAYGVPGELAYSGPMRVFPWTLVSSPEINYVGSTYYTVVEEGIATAGGTGEQAGLLVDPKSYVLYGEAVLNGALQPSMILPDQSIGQLAVMGIFNAILTTAAAVDDLLCFNNTTGLLASFSPNTTFAGSSSGTTLTVTGTPTGVLQPGSALGTGFLPGTIIVSNGTGTGGAGTYTINNSQTVAAGSYSAKGLPPSGYTAIQNGKVILRASAANGLAIIELTG
jgi:hypothetical protein